MPEPPMLPATIVVTGITGRGKSTTLNYFLAGEEKAPLPIGSSRTTGVETLIKFSSPRTSKSAPYKWHVKLVASTGVHEQSEPDAADAADAAAAEPSSDSAESPDAAEAVPRNAELPPDAAELPNDDEAIKEATVYRDHLKTCINEWRKRWKTEKPAPEKGLDFPGEGLKKLKSYLQHFLCTPMVWDDDTDRPMPPFYRIVEGKPVVTKPTRVVVTVPAPAPEFEGWQIIDTVGLRGEDGKDEYTCLRVNDAFYDASMQNPACALLVVMKDPTEQGFDVKLAKATERLAQECLVSNPCRAILVVDQNKKRTISCVQEAIAAIPMHWPALASNGVLTDAQRKREDLSDTDRRALMFDKESTKDIAAIHLWFLALGHAANQRANEVHKREAAFKEHEALAELADFIEDEQQLTDDALTQCLTKVYKKEVLAVDTEFSGAIRRFRRVNGKGWWSVQKALSEPFNNNIKDLYEVLDPARRYAQAIRNALEAASRCDSIPDAIVDKAATQLAWSASYTAAVEECFSSRASVKPGDDRLLRLMSNMPSRRTLLDSLTDAGPSAAAMREAIAEAIDDAVEAAYERAESDETTNGAGVVRSHVGEFAVTNIEDYAVFKDYFPKYSDMFRKEVAAAKQLGCAAPISPERRFPHAPVMMRAHEMQNRLVYERVNGRDLKAAIEHSGTAEARKQLFELLITAVKALHERGVAHRDLKPDNIIVCYAATGNELEKVVLIDFGSCSLGDENAPGASLYTTTANSWSDKYSAPEVLRKEPTAYKAADVYSLGRIAADMGFELTAGSADFCVEQLDKRVPGIATDASAVAKRLDELLVRFKDAPLEDVRAAASGTAPVPPPADAAGAPDRDSLIERLVEFIRRLIETNQVRKAYRRLLTLVTLRTRRRGRANPRSLHRVLEAWQDDQLRLLVAVADACRAGDASRLMVARRELLDALPSAHEVGPGMIYFIVSTAADGTSALAYVGKTDRKFAKRYPNGLKRDPADSLPDMVRRRWDAGNQRAGVLLRTSRSMPWGASEAAFICLLGTLFRLERDGINWAIGGRTDRNV